MVKKQAGRVMYLLLSVILLATGMLGLPGTAAANTPIPLSSLTPGATVSFAGYTWEVIREIDLQEEWRVKRQARRFMYLLLSFVFLATAMLGFSGPASANTLVPLSSLAVGNTVNFAGYTWIVLDPNAGYLLMNDAYGSDQPFDPDNTNVFDPTDTNNIAYYLNNTYYDSLPADDQTLIQTHSWTTGNETNESSSSVDCKIGLISYSEYTRYRTNITNLSDYWWIRTPYSGYSGAVWFVTPYGSRNLDLANVTHGVRPALYLNPEILVSGGNGGTVTSALGTPVITVVNGVAFSVTIDNTFGTLTATNNNSYGTITGVAAGNNGNTISGTLSALPIGTPTYIPLGSGMIEVEAVNPPSTTLDNSKSFY